MVINGALLKAGQAARLSWPSSVFLAVPSPRAAAVRLARGTLAATGGRHFENPLGRSRAMKRQV